MQKEMYLPIGTISIPFTINNTVDRTLSMDPCDTPAAVMQGNGSVFAKLVGYGPWNLFCNTPAQGALHVDI